MYSTIDMAKSFENAYFAGETVDALMAMKEHYDICNQLIEMKKTGKLDMSDAQLNGMLYINHWGGMLYNTIYLLMTDNSSYTPVGENKYEVAKSYIKDKKGDNTLCYSDAILQYAKKYCEKASELYQKPGDNFLKNRAIKAWDEMAVVLADIASNMSEVETMGYDNISLQMPFDQRIITVGETCIIRPCVYNFRETEKLSGYIEILGPDGEVIAQSYEFSVSPKKNTVIKIPVTLSKLSHGDYYIRLVEDGETISEHKFYSY